jgi:predicted GIY-YIG superfamily endonuclease
MPINGKRWLFTKESVDAAEDVPGVYALYDGTVLIYLGQSEESIRRRLQRHQSGKEGRCTQSATAYVEEPCSNPVAREAALIAEYKRANQNKLPRCNEVTPTR